ncbi:pyocin knob domain-containing protein [Neobacillus drentensis]|uniref:pyocin knob domain-containing protein n=1 Tax=Neobacillus drentensis TaxID=220684 RepID=UPI002FFEDAE7
MAYTKTSWADRVVQNPLTYTLRDNGDGTITLIPAEGSIVTSGTPITASVMNNLEKQYDEALAWVKSFGLGDVVKNIDNTDLNSLDATGFYSGATLTNAPTTADRYYIINLKYSGIYKAQIAIRTVTGTTFVSHRNNNNGTWGAWTQFAQYDATGKIAIANLPAATTAAAGIAQLVDSISDTSTNKAATANSVKSLQDWVKGYGLGTDVKNLGATDPNAITQTGFYTITSTANPFVANLPGTYAFYINHMQSGTSAYQMAFKISVNNDVYYRRCVAGTWEPWRQIETYENSMNYKGVDANTGITDLDDINIANGTFRLQSGYTAAQPNVGNKLPQGSTGTLIVFKNGNNMPTQIWVYSGGGEYWIRNYYTGAWSTWKKLATTDQEAWANATLVNSWTNIAGQTAGFYKNQFGEVKLRGYITGGTKTANTILFTLPAGYRPEQKKTIPVMASGGGSIETLIDILTTGEVRLVYDVSSYTNIALDNVSFRIA